MLCLTCVSLLFILVTYLGVTTPLVVTDGPPQQCTSTDGPFNKCREGCQWSGLYCVDVDECDEAVQKYECNGNETCVEEKYKCSEHADCVNTIGSYECRCHDGYRHSHYDNKSCVDVDECAEHVCEQNCLNIWGGFTCSCYEGYTLNSDNRTCSDINECSSIQNANLCDGTCVNEPGSYRCACPAGYRLSENNKTCIDIDECETGEAICAKGHQFGGTSEVCVNVHGSYHCQKVPCPSGYYLENNTRCRKTEECSPFDWICSYQPSTISYKFITLVSNLKIPVSQPVILFTIEGPMEPYIKIFFKLKLINENAPPNVAKADFSAFPLQQINNKAVTSLLQPLEGPQSIELEMSMKLYKKEKFDGLAVVRLHIFVSEYEF